MALILLIGQEQDPDKNISLYHEMLYRLEAAGHEIIDNAEGFGNENNSLFQNSLTAADVIIPVITDSFIKSRFYFNQFIQAKNYSNNRNDKIIIPILDKDAIDLLPDSLQFIKYLTIQDKFNNKELDKIVKNINEEINSFLGKRIANEEKAKEKAKEIKDRIEKTASIYISEAISELNKREKFQKYTALFWYILGFITLIFGIGIAIWFSDSSIANFNQKENWSLTILYAFKSVFIILLLIAASKYSFTLAKAYMSESLKIADRVHAISFGKFYLQVFNEQIESNEIKDIFRDWNINNQTNNFSKQSTSDYDPKLIEKIIELIDRVKK